MKKIVCVILFCLLASSVYSAEPEYKYRLYLKDKGVESQYYANVEPTAYLSPKALARRAKYNIPIDEKDYPVSSHYVKQLEDMGATVVAKSKWNNTVAVQVKDSLMIDQLKVLDFVTDTKLVWKGVPILDTVVCNLEERLVMSEDTVPNFYGYAYDNIRLMKGDTLHSRGFRGKGIAIAVIDAGYNNFSQIDYLDNVNILGSKAFVADGSSLFCKRNQHGLNVLSCMATNKPNRYVGTAPDASYWMLGSEDPKSEFPIEEDYWAAAAEFADSVGVELINTSLGYIDFDAPAQSHTHDDLDGETAFISKAANVASAKGILVVVSAGNSGSKPWRVISPPADSRHVLSVGAINRDSTIARFSSQGLTADLRIKPDVVALGAGSVLIDEQGKIALKNGTSFSSPITCGLVACLWQAFPSLSNVEIINVMREASDRYDDPDIKYGFGIPDMEKAMQLAEKRVSEKAQR